MTLTYQRLDIAYPDKGWESKLIIQRDALGGWILEDLPESADEIFSALYFGRPLTVHYVDKKHSDEGEVHEMTIHPLHLSISTQECVLRYRLDNPASQSMQALPQNSELDLKHIIQANMLITPN